MGAFIVTTFDIHDSDGDYVSSGYYDSGWRFDVDQVEDLTDIGYPVDGDCAAERILEAVEYLRYSGATEHSSSHFSPWGWYSWADRDQDYTTGHHEMRGFHLHGFTVAEKREIHRLLTGGQR